ERRMLKFPVIPKWWELESKFMHLEKGFTPPNYIIGYDTETYNGQALTQQFVTHDEEKLQWITGETILDKFLDYMEKFDGYIIVYCFNAKFDLALLLRKFLKEFMEDDFEIDYRNWNIKVFCSKNWHAS